MAIKPQLFCFTYAGGTAAFFDEIEKDLDGIELVKLEYAGHGGRHKEEFYNNFNELADDLFNLFRQSYKGGNYALFGYSMGSISLVEVLKRIMASEYQEPVSIFMAAHEPHTNSIMKGFSEEDLDTWVKERTVRFGGIPDRLLNNKVFWRTYLPIYRSDYMLISNYDFKLLDFKSDIPASVFYSETDTPRDDMQAWDRYFPCEFYHFDGTHFFIQEHHSEMADIIRRRIGITR